MMEQLERACWARSVCSSIASCDVVGASGLLRKAAASNPYLSRMRCVHGSLLTDALLLEPYDMLLQGI